MEKDDFYQDTYDPKGEGTVFVFNNFYSVLKEMGIHSSLAALPGEDLKRYIGYAEHICRGGGTMKTSFVEWDSRRFGRWQKMFKDVTSPIKHRIELISGSILAQEHLFRYRVQDIGIGAGAGKVLSLAQTMLYEQMRVSVNYHKWKVQILDMSIRGIPARELGCALQRYLGTAGVQVRAINGKTLEDFTPTALFNKQGRVVHRYEDKLVSNYRCAVREHEFEVSNITDCRKSAAEPKLFAYTCRNGANMLQLMLVYK